MITRPRRHPSCATPSRIGLHHVCVTQAVTAREPVDLAVPTQVDVVLAPEDVDRVVELPEPASAYPPAHPVRRGISSTDAHSLVLVTGASSALVGVVHLADGPVRAIGAVLVVTVTDAFARTRWRRS